MCLGAGWVQMGYRCSAYSKMMVYMLCVSGTGCNAHTVLEEFHPEPVQIFFRQ